jgi:hypothetical protein
VIMVNGKVLCFPCGSEASCTALTLEPKQPVING